MSANDESSEVEGGGFPPQSRISSGLATPTHTNEASFSSSDIKTSSNVKGLSSELMYHEKLKRFKEYMTFSNIMTLGSSNSPGFNDNDVFFYDSALSQSLEGGGRGFYVRPRNVPRITHCSDAMLNACKDYDVRRPQEVWDAACQKAEKYDDSLSLVELVDEISTLGYDSMLDFKNNLVDNWKEFSFYACETRIVIVKDRRLLNRMETRPSFTLREHIDASVSYEHPHMINFIKVSKLNGKDVLIVCADDGRGIVYELFENVLPRMIIEVKMGSSVWGADSFGDYLVFSDNSHSITLFMIRNGFVSFTRTARLQHNVPDLKIIHVHGNTVLVACVSISSEMAIFEFEIVRTDVELEIGKTRKVIKCNTATDASFEGYQIKSSVKDSLNLDGQGWSINRIHRSYFKEVNNPLYLGVDSIDPNMILEKSMILNLEENYLVTSNVGGAAEFENLVVETTQGESDDFFPVISRLDQFMDNFHRVRKKYFRSFDEESPHDRCLKDIMLLTTTDSKVALYSADGLINNSHTANKLFGSNLPHEESHYNRLSITRVIPGLSAVIAISQAGFIAVLRLVKHRGIYAFREEHILRIRMESPDISATFDPISGCGFRKVSDCEEVYRVEITTASGMTRCFLLQEADDSERLLVEALI